MEIKYGLFKFRIIGVAVVTILAFPGIVHSSLIMNFVEVGPNVVGTVSGTVDLIGLTPSGFPFPSSSSINPATAYASLGTNTTVIEYSGISGPISFGTTSSSDNSDSGSGALVGVNGAVGRLILPASFTGGTVAATSTWNSTQFSDWGITPGSSFVFTWGSDTNGDSLTVNFNSPVPEPATFVIWSLLGLVGIVGYKKFI